MTTTPTDKQCRDAMSQIKTLAQEAVTEAGLMSMAAGYSTLSAALRKIAALSHATPAPTGKYRPCSYCCADLPTTDAAEQYCNVGCEDASAYKSALNGKNPADIATPAPEAYALDLVAQIAATCMIDLRFNLKEACKEWLSGKIAKGAYEHVQHRHDSLYAALHAAGFTEQHQCFKYPVRPTAPQPAPKQEG